MGMESGQWRACVDPVHSLLQIIHKSRNPTLVIFALLAVNDKTTYIVSLLCEMLQNYVTTSLFFQIEKSISLLLIIDEFLDFFPLRLKDKRLLSLLLLGK